MVVPVVVPTVVAQVSTLQVSTFVESVVAGASVFAPELHAAIENATAAIKMNFFMNPYPTNIQIRCLPGGILMQFNF